MYQKAGGKSSPGGNLGGVDRHLIYGLIDPRDGQLRYVGKSCEGLKRPRAHARRLKWDRGHCRNWVKGLVDLGLKPDIEVLETCDSPKALIEAEQFHIAYFRMVGCNLTNLTAGGEGQWGLRFSEERRRRISRNGTWQKRDEALKLYVSGMSTRAVAEELSIGNVSVYMWARQAGLLRSRTEARNLYEAKKVA